jgi:hypothetical protein
MVAAGFAASLARPGGNITGISLMSTVASEPGKGSVFTVRLPADN